MKFSLIICTYQRPKALEALLESVAGQRRYPDEILVIDGSEDGATEEMLKRLRMRGLFYYKVPEAQRGLTRQRNYGVSQLMDSAEVVCFLDDDVILDTAYFEELLHTYKEFPKALGVGGYICGEVPWKKLPREQRSSRDEFLWDGWVRPLGRRFSLRRKLGLEPDTAPGRMPAFSHGYSSGYLPPSGKTYEVELLMGGVCSYRREVLDRLRFSSYFEGYGLYEDADFSLRAARMGKLYVNTRALLEHRHAAAGRPDSFGYGRMVVRNGWYVWRVKNRRPGLREQLKWHATSLLLTLVRFGNVLGTDNRKEALREGFGRLVGWGSLWWQKPLLEEER